MSKKKKYIPKDFESSGRSGDTSANIYNSMMMSDAFKALTKNQRLLYVYMKLQYYSVSTSKHPNDNREMFYFNKGLWCDVYGLYKNADSFANDRDALIEKGFIKVIDIGYNTKTKAIYQFSAQWRLYGTSAFNIPKQHKSLTLQRKEREETDQST